MIVRLILRYLLLPKNCGIEKVLFEKIPILASVVNNNNNCNFVFSLQILNLLWFNLFQLLNILKLTKKRYGFFLWNSTTILSVLAVELENKRWNFIEYLFVHSFVGGSHSTGFGTTFFHFFRRKSARAAVHVIDWNCRIVVQTERSTYIGCMWTKILCVWR